MPRRARRTRKPDKDDLRSFQRFSGTLSDGDRSIPVRFKARIGEGGEVELDIHAFRITKANWFVRERFQARDDVAEFVLNGVTADGLRFETDSLSFNSLGSRFSGVHNRHWSKPRGECGKVQYFRTIDPARELPVLKLHLKGFDCFPPLYATCALGKIQVAGETTLSEADRLTGWIVIEADKPPADTGVWRAEAERFAEHLRRILSVAASTMLQAPILEFVAGDSYETEVLSQTRQHAPVMRVFHKLNLQPVLDAAIVSLFDPPVEAKNLFFAIEWFAMATTYNEVRLVKPKAKPSTPKGPTPPAGTVAPAGSVPTGMALASHRSNFALMDAIPVAKWIDWLAGKRDVPEDTGPITFLRFNYAGRPFLAPAQALMPFKSPYLWFEALHGHPFWREQWEQYVAGPVAPFFAFAMEESAAAAFLNTLTGLIRSGTRRLPDALDLPTGELAGIGSGDSRDGHFVSARDELARGDYDYALFRDGLALISGPPPRKLTGVRSWHPKEGLD